MRPATLPYLLLALIAACLGGCGPGEPDSASAAPGEDAQGGAAPDDRAAAYRDLRLGVEGLVTDPKGPTTASTVTVAFTVVNHGTDATPYTHSNGRLAYLPITWTVVRDGVAVARGTIAGLTGEDAQPCRAVLHDEPVGDRSYHVTLEGAGTGASQPISSDTVTVPFGGSG